ncbi:MAG: hypothetical protein JXE07_02415 [Candidatus Aminicenantes bacterium]|nr:hypothetical protein [Candidatus Aminicenantes bacterium]
MVAENFPQKKAALGIILAVFLFSLGFSLFINLPVVNQHFLFADQAVYYALTQSIAHDLDLEYTRKDLIRYYHDFNAGPQGIFLKKARNDKIFYAKSWAYSLFAAPFVRMFGYNGIYVFHSVLLLIVMVLGYAYFSLANSPLTSISYLLTFLFGSVAGVYYLWISPDFFNFCVVFILYFLWIYKIKRRETPAPGPALETSRSFLLSPGTDYLAACLVGLAVFSKPPNIVLMAPLVLFALSERKFFKALVLSVVFILTIGLLFGANYLLTSDWNYQGGERKTFIEKFPLEKSDATFDSLGSTMTSENYFQRFLIPPKFIIFNIFYYFFGRFTGIAWYFFPALLAMILFFRSRRRIYDWLTLLALAGGILVYIVLTPEFYGGGGGSLANRYFLNIYPLFLFLPSAKKTRRQVLLIWIIAAVFISQILVSPFRSSAQPATHAKKFPIKALPLEMTQVNHFPTNTNPLAFRVSIWPDKPHPQREFIHFLDDNFFPRLEPTGIWTRGDKTCEFILKTYYPLREIGVRLLNNPRSNNEITVKVEGQRQKIILQSKQWGELRFTVGNGFKMQERYHYRMRIKASKGSIPYYEDPNSLERRYLGVFFELELVPKE